MGVRWPRAWLVFALLAVFFALGVPLIFRGRIVADEGWYLLAASNLWQGKLPYRDYLFTQPPGLLLLYAPVVRAFGPSMEVGRAFSCALGATGLSAVTVACGRRGGMTAAALGGLLLATSGTFATDMATVRTQPPTVALTGIALACLAARRTTSSRTIAVAAMTLAVATRLSMAPVLALTFLFLFVEDKKEWPFSSLLATGSLLVFAALYGFFEHDGQLRYGVYTFHSALRGGVVTSEVVSAFFRGFASDQAPIVLALLLAAARLAWGGWSALCLDHRRYVAFTGASYLVTTAIHASRPVSYSYYQTSSVAFAVAFAAPVLALPFARPIAARARALWALGFAGAVAAFPFARYDLSLADDHGTPEQARVAGGIVARLAPGGTILTANIELVTASGLHLLPGYELSQFSYQRNAPEEVAHLHHVANESALWRDVLEARADVLCLTPWYVGIWTGDDADAFQELVRRGYALQGVIPGYGQFVEPLYVLIARRLRSPGSASSRTPDPP